MSDVYTYVVQYDRGLAPNPFGGFCTLAVCTPNHMSCQAKPGDWIAGVSGAERGHQLIYAMQVSKVMHFNDYFNDPNFASKKPVQRGTPEQRCGDNFYSLDAQGRWLQHWSPWHYGSEALQQDTKHPRAFIAERFWYLGREAVSLPNALRPMFGGHGMRKRHTPGQAAEFQEWVIETLREGLIALPRDLEASDDCASSTGCSLPPRCGGTGTCG